jgi:hypothetical protein
MSARMGEAAAMLAAVHWCVGVAGACNKHCSRSRRCPQRAAALTHMLCRDASVPQVRGSVPATPVPRRSLRHSVGGRHSP